MEYVNLNGQLVRDTEAKIHVSDLGLRRGYGAFEFFRVLRGVPVFIEDHLERFVNSSQAIGLEVPYSRAELEGFIRELIRVNGFQNAGIQLVLTGGYSEDIFTPGHPNLIIAPIALREYPPALYRQGVKVITHRHVREIPEAKTIAYLTAVKLGPRMKAEGAAEVIYHDGKWVSEGARSSLGLVKEGVLITAKDGVLPGITRLHALRLAAQLMPVEQRAFTLEELYAADEVFITSSTRGVMPVTRIDDRPVGDGRVGPRVSALVRAFEAHVEEYLARHAALDSR
jgi:D-alanine transaminase/branched-chain amino acid aminotransferase